MVLSFDSESVEDTATAAQRRSRQRCRRRRRPSRGHWRRARTRDPHAPSLSEADSNGRFRGPGHWLRPVLPGCMPGVVKQIEQGLFSAGTAASESRPPARNPQVGPNLPVHLVRKCHGSKADICTAIARLKYGSKVLAGRAPWRPAAEGSISSSTSRTLRWSSGG